jgi:hypothetical protein
LWSDDTQWPKSESLFLAHATIERIRSHKLRKDSLLARESSDKNPMVKLSNENPMIKQKKKAKKNEIDDIFDFKNT